MTRLDTNQLTQRGVIRTGYGSGRPEIWHAHEVDEATRRADHGSGIVEMTDKIVAGELTTVSFEFLVGRQTILAGGQLGVFWRWAYDWSDLQTTDPTQPGFLTLHLDSAEDSANSAEESAELKAEYNAYGGIEPYNHVLKLKVQRGALRAGDRVRIVCGDRSAGGAGWRTPTLNSQDVCFLMLVDPSGNEQWTELPGSRSKRCAIVSGSPVRLVVVAASDVVVGEKSLVIVRAEDRWGNATVSADLTTLSIESRNDGVAISNIRLAENQPAYHADVTARQPGTYRINATVTESGLTASSNPMRVYSQAPIQRVFWGDLHAGQCNIGCGAGSLAQHYAFGRDVAGLQIITHQANDHYVTVADWKHTRSETEAFCEPHRFVTFLGCEWSPPTRDGGDRNVFYRHDEPRLRRSARFFTEADPDPEPDIPKAPEFLDAFREEDVLINIHVGGRMTNLDWYEPAIERLAEVHSTHGTSEWFVMDCLERGYQVGITAGTDGVMGRPGACHPGSRVMRNLRSGLTAILAEELTRESIWTALKARRCYATTGERILLSVDVDGQPMGTACRSSGSSLIRISVEGTAAIERIDLLRGTEVIHAWDLAPLMPASSNLLRVLWSGTARRGTARLQRQIWDGSLSIRGGRIVAADPICFHSPLDTVSIDSPQQVSWKSCTAGNDAGLLLHVEDVDRTGGRFESDPSTFEFSMDDLRDSIMEIDAGGVGRRVRIGPPPSATASRSVQLEFRDEQQTEGLCPYWVRVIQVDRAKAWSSPVYVTRGNG